MQPEAKHSAASHKPASNKPSPERPGETVTPCRDDSPAPQMHAGVDGQLQEICGVQSGQRGPKSVTAATVKPDESPRATSCARPSTEAANIGPPLLRLKEVATAKKHELVSTSTSG